MKTIDIETFKKDFNNLIESTLLSNQALRITTENGSIIALSEDDYVNLLEALDLITVPNSLEEVLI